MLVPKNRMRPQYTMRISGSLYTQSSVMKKYFSEPYFFYLALLSFGVSLAFTFQLNYLSSIFNFLGAEPQQLSFLWLAPPVTGLIIQPLVGQLSDDTISRYGKRRPYIIGGGILSVLSLFALGALTSLSYAVLLILLLNATVNCCLAALRAFTTDLSPPEDLPKAFAFQAFLGGIGAAIGAGLPYLTDRFSLLFSRASLLKTEQLKLPLNFQLSLLVAGIAMGLTLFVSMRNVKEPSHICLTSRGKKPQKTLLKNSVRIFVDLGSSLKDSSFKFKKCCLINSVTWFGIFIFWVYFVIVIAQNFYPSAALLNEHWEQSMQPLQQASLDSAGYLSFSQYVTIIYSLFLFFLLEDKNKMEFIHGISLLIGGVGMILIGYAHTPAMIFLAMAGVGILFGSLSVLPFAIVGKISPEGKSGVYLGIFNIGITLSQIIGGLTLSPIYRYFFNNQAANLMILSGVIILLSALLWLQEAYRSQNV